MRSRSLLFAYVALGATVSVVSAQPSVSTSTASPAAITCIQTCNERVQPSDPVPCGQDGIDCNCTPPNLADALFFCFQALCPDAATEADKIMSDTCTDCDACSVQIQGNALVITGPSGASILPLPAAASTPPTSGTGTASPGTAGGNGTVTGGTGSATGGQGGSVSGGTGGSSSSSSGSSSSNSAGSTSTGAKPADPAAAGSNSQTATSSQDAPSPSTSPAQDPETDDSAALALVTPAATGWLVLAALSLIAVV
ncbi:hypothetical protein EXIGLDRAFT_753685 [Exidia glandulosa HHB12029]|uniref:Extracellular membrane protein CFEM domain-containing protein n=1 Tax=Exidia glandulosa HHB12029 TaxID=1314781 RepID=A0A165DK16_EXIGL|nr:hypothetical protein EXIGLDRAFT_753685 [Exidia glandulosa HHB12029]